MNDPPWDNHYSFDDLYPEPSDFSKIKRGIEFELYGFVERGMKILLQMIFTIPVPKSMNSLLFIFDVIPEISSNFM